MHFKTMIACSVFVLSQILSTAAAVAATLSVNSTGGTTYVVQGGGFSGVAALDVTVRYDASTLGSPKITQGTLANGTLFVSNPNIVGQVRLAFVHQSGISGSGPLATIEFTPVGGGTGKITGISGSIFDANGTTLPLTAGVGNVQEQPVQSAGTGSPSPSSPFWTGGSPTTTATTTEKSGTTTTSGGMWPGTISLGGEPGGGSEPAKTAATTSEPPPMPVSPPATGGSEILPSKTEAPAPAKERQRLTLPIPPANVLERFRTYAGERSVAALKPLFAKLGGAWVTQEPAMVPADGKTKLTVQITLERAGLEAPNFALRGLEMISLKPVGEAGWLVEALPLKGAQQATISLLVEDAAAELPVTVIPLLPSAWANKKLTEAEVNRYLTERGTEKAPLGDLNGDGRRDYRDDYIMVGNYLLATLPVKEKVVAKDAAKDSKAMPAESPVPVTTKPASLPAPAPASAKDKASPAKP